MQWKTFENRTSSIIKDIDSIPDDDDSQSDNDDMNSKTSKSKRRSSSQDLDGQDGMNVNPYYTHDAYYKNIERNK